MKTYKISSLQGSSLELALNKISGLDMKFDPWEPDGAIVIDEIAHLMNVDMVDKLNEIIRGGYDE